MLFPSVVFLFYFLPVTIILYFLLSPSRKAQNLFLVFASLFFYAWGEVRNVIILLTVIVIYYFAARCIERCTKHKKKVLLISILLDVGILFLFKYTGFVVANLQPFLSIPSVHITLPLGISFFILQAISYVCDIYRNDGVALRNPFDLALYIALFPQLIAGPIVRYNTFEKQIKNRTTSIRKLSLGTCRFISGMVKKVFIANVMAVAVDAIYGWNDMGELSMCVAWLGAIMYMFQIYYDFSGYSDMAIGLGLMFGFVFEENFNYPYISKSISEFWRRWHISLCTWIRDYIYIPLGGSRVKNSDKMIRNVLIVWLVTGIWHGAEWTFVLWGLYNFVFIFIEKVIHLEERTHMNWLRHIYTLFVICTGMVFFRSQDLMQAGSYFSSMFSLHNGFLFDDRALMLLKEYGIFMLLAAIFATPVCRRFQQQLLEKKWHIFTNAFTCLYPIVMMTLFIICVSYIAKGSYNPFIYFNF